MFGGHLTHRNLRPDGLPHMQHQPGAEADEPPKSPGPTSSIFTMEAREGRIGNAFACERCRKHKVRCVPSDTAGICQRYVSRDVSLHSGDTCTGARRRELSVSNMLREEDQQRQGAAMDSQRIGCATSTRSSISCRPSSRLWHHRLSHSLHCHL